MPAPFLLDTNVYALFFQPSELPYRRLISKLLVGSHIGFYISEITSMEIRSVFGKWRRGRPFQIQTCGRSIVVESGGGTCAHMWATVELKRMRIKVYRGLMKMVADIENQRGNIQATLLPVNADCTRIAQQLLARNADRYSFGSHDALIAASAIVERAINGRNLTIATSDRGLKAVLKEEEIPFYDPRSDQG